MCSPTNPHWSPISCVLPPPGRSAPSRAEVCVGSRFVRLVQALSSFPPSAGLVPCPSTLRFSFPLPFQGLPAPGQVCRVGVLSFFFCVPLFASWLSNFHLIFKVISPSLPPHPHLHLIFRRTTLPKAGCVCVTHLYRCKTFISCYKTSISCYIYIYAGDHRGPGGVGDQRRHLPGTRANVPAGLW